MVRAYCTAHMRFATRLGAIAATVSMLTAAVGALQVQLQQSTVATRSGDCRQQCHKRIACPTRQLNALLLHFSAALQLQLLLSTVQT
jgi:hypothetical protein